MEKSNRPVDLPLFKIRLPIGGIISIVHRVTGVLLVVLLPVATYWLGKSLESPAGYDETVEVLGSAWVKLAAVILMALFVQHLVSGIRHLLLDLHVGIEKKPARMSAWSVAIISFSVMLLFAWVMVR